MKMVHTVFFRSGRKERYFFNTKKESDKAKYNAIYLAQTFGQITHVEISAINNISINEILKFPQNYD